MDLEISRKKCVFIKIDFLPLHLTIYTLHLKSHNFNKFSDFICPYQKIVVYLRSQFHAGDVCASSAGVADIFKRRLLTLCSDVVKSRKFQKYSGLSNDRCPTGYRLSLLCLFGTLFAY